MLSSPALIEFVYMLVIDLAFLLVLTCLMLPLGIWRQAAFAVMKRNFSGYFSNPTGYVFLCLFVLLTSFAAFWPHEFFTTNLANFDQLNRFLPFIMLIFIPAITMSIWAEERRQGTDELLLTLPARDFDIVIGKYFAAVFVFTVSLLFSQLSNYAVLLAMTGGSLDTWLLFSTYFGYWFMGIAMLALGMVASFLTNNLTVGFIFGAAFNAPLAFFSRSDVILSDSRWIQRLFEWSLLQRFEPFGRGLISPSSIVYFLGIVCIGVYFSLILIGRRHWMGGRDGTSMFWHYLLRGVFLVAMVLGTVLVVQYSPINQARVDISSGQVSTLSPTSRTLLTELANEQAEESDATPPATITIDAYVSGNLPTEFVQTSYNLVNLLREFDVLGGNRIKVNLQQGIQPYSQEAIHAEQRYGIRPEKVVSRTRGAIREEDIIFGVAVSSGRQRHVIPFIPYGTPVEYRLMRAIESVAKPARKKLGVIRTDASVLGDYFDITGEDGKVQRRQLPMMRIFAELQEEYDVEQVSAAQAVPVWLEDDAGKPARRRFDVMIVVQPSKMSPTEIQNLAEVIRLGQPLVIFEDVLPNPVEFQTFPGTFFPRTIGRPTAETGDIQKILDLLDLNIDRIKRQQIWFPTLLSRAASNPYKRDRSLELPERLVIRDEEIALSDKKFADHPVTRGITEIEMDFAAAITPSPDSKLEFLPLVTSGRAGTISMLEFGNGFDFQNGIASEQLVNYRTSPERSYPVIAQIRGSAAPVSDTAEDPGQPADEKINVIWVADVDMLSDRFVQLRDFPISGDGVEYRFQNVALVQNMVDYMAGTDTWMDLRNRRQRQSTLTVVENAIAAAMARDYELTQKFMKDKTQAEMKLMEEIRSRLEPLKKQLEAMEKRGQRDEEYQVKMQQFEALAREQVQPAQAQMEQMNIELQEQLRQLRLDAELEIQQTQRNFKLAAVIIPPIPPLLMGLIVWTRRRLLEREGISKARRLK